MLRVEGASWKEQPASAAMRSPGSRAPTGAAEPQWGGKGQQGKYFLGMHPPGLTSAEFLLLSQSTLSAHPTTRSLRLQQANVPHPIPPGVGGLSELGLGAVVPARRSGRVTPASLGVGSSASQARAGRGRAPRRSGGVCPRGWRARGECPGEKRQTCAVRRVLAPGRGFLPGASESQRRRDARRRQWRRAPGLCALGRRAVPA